MTSQQIQAEIAELKMDYIRLQGDMEKLESTGHPTMIEKAEQRLGNMEIQLAELNKKLAAL
ncbi:SE1832 family protein [Paenisporosarcina sp. TG20]|uniref:SE1832 family protein n=1 Tax=Paenisporosarcina sp. TG20 TaxID=1211706 RepID=UPI0002E420AC|nr:SE1832 family protein [Paenisporosarcina sp. TG20]